MALLKHVFRLKDGTKKETDFWYYRFQYKGKTYFGSTKTANKKQAEAVEKKTYEALINKYELGLVESITVAKAISNYLAAIKGSDKYTNNLLYTTKLVGLKTNNRSKAREDVSIFGFDADWNFERITNSNVSQLILSRKSEGNKSGTILNELSVLSQVIDINRQLAVPVPNIDFKDLKRLNQLKPSTGKLRYLTKKEETDLLAELHPDKVMNGIGGEGIETTKAQRQDIYDLVILLLDTGARYGEMCALTWDDIDIKAGTMNIYRPKVNNQSVLHFTKRMTEVLTRRLANTDSKYVFTAKDDGPRKYSAAAFEKACKRASIEGVTIHTCRHTNASRLVQRGLSLIEVQQQLGHKNISTTAIYAHLVPNQAAKRAAQLLDAE